MLAEQTGRERVKCMVGQGVTGKKGRTDEEKDWGIGCQGLMAGGWVSGYLGSVSRIRQQGKGNLEQRLCAGLTWWTRNKEQGTGAGEQQGWRLRESSRR